MPTRRPTTWRDLAARQGGVISRGQLGQLGFDHHYVDSQIAAERWRSISDVVLATVTGDPTRRQLMWAGCLHAGSRSAVGGLTALEVAGLRNWHRDDVSILLPKSHNLEPIEGVRFVETRRPISLFASRTSELPLWRVEPAALLFAAYEPVSRTAYGLLSAVVQQGLTTPARLDDCITALRPLRRAKPFRRLLAEIAGGVQSLSEYDVTRMCRRFGLPLPTRQTRRRDASGRLRYTDAEWRLPDGRVLILEVDGGFHMEVEHWTDDIERERDLVATGAVLVRCTSCELRDTPERVASALERLGVGRSSA